MCIRDREKKTKFHRAKADCYYTALILELLDWKKAGRLVSVDYHRLPAAREEEIYLVFPDYSKYVSREFDSKEEALQDNAFMSIVVKLLDTSFQTFRFLTVYVKSSTFVVSLYAYLRPCSGRQCSSMEYKRIAVTRCV